MDVKIEEGKIGLSKAGLVWGGLMGQGGGRNWIGGWGLTVRRGSELGVKTV